jgi:hypothetical protein
MPKTDSSPYSLKRLRELCINIHDEQMASLLRTTLADFPVSVIDELFTGSKLNKPSGPDDREWADIVRLTLIAFGPEGSEPARFRGKRIPRYKRQYPFDANRDDADAPGVFTLYPTDHTSPLLAEIAVALGVISLKIECAKWFSCFLANPFPLKHLFVRSGWTPVPESKADLSEVIAVLPETLEELELGVSGFPLSGNGISRLKQLQKITLFPDSLNDGLDFSANAMLKEIKLQIKNGGNKSIKGVNALADLQHLFVKCEKEIIPFEPIDVLFQRRLEHIELTGVKYLSEKIDGFSPNNLKINAKGLKYISLIDPHRDSNKTTACIEIGHSSDLQNVSIDAGVRNLSIHHCEKLADLKARMFGESTDFILEDCVVLSKVEADFEKKADDVVFKNLPALSDVTLTSPSGCDGLSGYYRGSGNGPNAKFLMRNTGLKNLPVFRGGWRGFSIMELSENQNLDTLDGIEVLPDLVEIRLNMQSGMSGFFKKDATQKMPSVRTIKADQITLSTPARLDLFTNLEDLQLISCNDPTWDQPLSLSGVEALEFLATLDLSSSGVRSLSPLAGLPNLKSVRVSGCEKLKPKSPRVLLDGPLLLSELARHAGPDHPSLSKMPSMELVKIVELIGEGARSDVTQGLALLPALEPADKAKLVRCAAIDPKSGWIRLPYISKIDETQARGIPQLRILQAVDNEETRAILSSVTSVLINKDCDDSSTTLRFGKARDSDAGHVDDILEEFSSLESLPDLENVTKISINGFGYKSLSHFSLNGVEKFLKLKELSFHDVKQIDDLGALANSSSLERLRLCGLPLKNLMCLGTHPSLTDLTLRCDLESLEGLENFASLETLQIQSTEDVSRLFDYAKGRGCRIAFNGSTGDNDSFWWVRFEFQSKN